MTPAEELRAAVSRLENLPGAASRGPKWMPRSTGPLAALLRAAADASDDYPALHDPTSDLSRMAASEGHSSPAYRRTADLIRAGLDLARLVNGAAS